MAGIDYKFFCNHGSEDAEKKFFRASAKGGAAAFAAAYPTEDSIVLSSCERAVMVSTDSFIRRPSVCDEAMEGIMGFVNEGIYALQEPRKRSLCSMAVLYIFRGKARCVTMGNSAVFWFLDGKLASASQGKTDILPGQSLRAKFEFEPEFELGKGKNAFLIVSSANSCDLDIPLIENALQSSEGAENWLEAISPELEKCRCSVMTMVLPQRKKGLADLLNL